MADANVSEDSLYNYGYNTFLGSDYIDVDKINDNFKLIDAKLANCYVTRQGVNGSGWWYIEYSNGVVLFGLDSYSVGTVPLNIKWYDYYSSSSLYLPGTYPIPMSKVPYLHIMIQSYDINDSFSAPWVFMHCNTSNEFKSTTVPPAWCIYWWPPGDWGNREQAILRNVKISAFGFGKR